jgi:mono/diheme cytochrome c family protein
MVRSPGGSWWVRPVVPALVILVSGGLVAAGATHEGGPEVNPDQVLRGRQLVIENDCGGCHGGGADPAAEDWLVGMTAPEQEFRIGACYLDLDAEPCFRTRPSNLTPHGATGMGRYTERQIFNSLRYGLRPAETPDVEITSSTPGEGNFPEQPKYLAPPMPWNAWRHFPDEDLWAMAAYLKHGLKPVENRVADSEAPPDSWASGYTDEEIGSYPAPPFPTEREAEPAGNADRARVLRGRQVVIERDCGGCHGGGSDPAAEGWLAGITAPEQEFLIGPCYLDLDAQPCFRTRPRNLTPHNTMGMGRFTERQIFNSLRYGLRPGETPDVEITSTVPGVGNFPEHPKYLAVPMPWYAWRHIPDQDLWAIAAYLKHGLKPAANRVMDSDGPPDFWASDYTVEKIGAYPAPPFPTAREVAPQ